MANLMEGIDAVSAACVDAAAGSPPESPPVSPPISRALRFIDTYFAQPLSLDTLASVAGLSVSRFASRFRSEVGISPHRYLCLVRIRRAQDLLRAGLPPSIVASEVGFFDQSHLGRHFRRTVGITPRDFVANPAAAREGAAGAAGGARAQERQARSCGAAASLGRG